MFSSVSSCIPGSTANTSYTASTRHNLDISTNVTVRLDGSIVAARPIAVFPGNLVSASVTTGPGYLDYQFISYTIDSRHNSFAVVNRNNYNPTIKSADAQRRWYNYPEEHITVSRYSTGYDVNASTGMNRDLIDVDSLHVVLDHWNQTVYFYDQYMFIAEVGLPAGPIDYRKINYSAIGTYTQDLLILANDGRLYRIRFDNQYVSSDQFDPRVVNIVDLDNLPYTEDIPTVGSFENLARKRRRAGLFPIIKALDVVGNSIIVAGSNSLFVTDINYNIIITATLSGEDIMHVAAFGNGAILVTTKTHRVYIMNLPNTFNLVYSSSALGHPYQVPGTNTVAVPEGNQQRLLIFNSAGTYTIWTTPEFVPAYCRAFDNSLWVTGHDTNSVYQFTAANTYNRYDFFRRVTLVSVLGNDIIGIHALQYFDTLDTPGIYKVIPFRVEDRTGPVNHIGTRPVQPLMLGSPISPIPGPNLVCWTNGIMNGIVNSQDYFSVSYRAIRSGTFTNSFILGETAIDYTTTVVTSSSILDHYTATTALHRLTPVYGIYDPPDIGNYDQGTTILDSIGFTINMWGSIYSNINVSTNGYLTFDSYTTYTANQQYGDLLTDAIFVEPGDLLQDYPIDNTDPMNIKKGRLDSAEVPTIYVKPQLLGEFRGYRIRWVGTSMRHYPLGNLANVVTSISSYNQIPIDDINLVNVNDYVSGNGIVVSTQVVSKYSYTNTATTYGSNITTNTFLVSDSITPPKYANISISGTKIATVLANSSTIINGNTVLSQVAGTVVVDGISPGPVDSSWIYKFGGVKQIGAASIVRQAYTITSISSVVANTAIQVNLSDYNQVYLNQTIFGANLTSTSIVGRRTVVKTFVLTANATTVVEGNAVAFSLSTTNVAAGSGYNYSLIGPGFDANDLVSGSTTGTFTVGSTMSALFVTNSDALIEGTETVTFSLANIYPGYSVPLSVSVDLVDSGTSIITPKTASASFTEYYIDVAAAQTLSNADVINLEKTSISFASIPLVSGTAVYELHTLTADSTVPAIGGATTLVLSGNFVEVNNTATVSSATSLLFKANVPAPTYSYEVGLYAGRNYQYIELYYDRATHSSTANIGPAAGDITKPNARMPVTTASGTSVLFGSESTDGIWRYLGTGSFSSDNSGFNPRTPRFQIERTLDPTELGYVAYIDQEIPIFANVRASLDYGRLYLNGGFYDGTQNLAKNDQLTIYVPFGSTLRPSVSVLGIGDYQLPLPTAPANTISTIPTDINLQNNYPRETLANSTITIATTGLYMLPVLYKSQYNNTGLDYIFQANISGTVANLTVGNYYQLSAGDTISVVNQFSSARKFDTRDIVINGPRTLIYRTRTAGDATFARFDYPTLVQPFVRYVDDWAPGLPYYRTANILASGPASALVFATGAGVELVINGLASGQANTVTSGSNLALQWTVPTYSEQPVTVYQIYQDLIDAGNVYVDIGSWNIENKIISSIADIDVATIIQPDLEPIIDTNRYIVANLASQLVDQSDQILTSLAQELVSSIAGSGTRQILTDFVGSYTTILVNTIASEWTGSHLALSQTFGSQLITAVTGSVHTISSEGVPNDGTWFLVDQIDVERLSGTYTIVPSRLEFDSNRLQFALILVDQIRAEHFTSPSWNFAQTISMDMPIVQQGQFVWHMPVATIADPITVSYHSMPQSQLLETSTLIRQSSSEPQFKELVGIFTGPLQLVTSIQSTLFSSFNIENLLGPATMFIDLTQADPGAVQITVFSSGTEPEIVQVTEFFDSSSADSLFAPSLFTAAQDSLFIYYTVIEQPNFVSEHVLPATMIESVIDSNFEQINQIYTAFAAESVIETQVFIEFATEYLQNTELLTRFTTEYLQNTQLLPEFTAEYLQNTQLLPEFTAEYLINGLIVNAIDNEYQLHNFIPQDLDPELYRPMLFYPELAPMVVQEHIILNDFNIVRLDPVGSFVQLVPIQLDYRPVPVKFDFELYQDYLHESLLLDQQTTASTYIGMYADGGRGGDRPNYPSQLPFVFYQRSWSYGPAAFVSQQSAAVVAAKYVTAEAIQIVGTDYWNYRIYFDTSHVCYPRSGLRFPVTWLIRGG